MSIVSMTGNDTIKINNKILADFASDDIATLSFPNEIAAVKTGKNGNSIYAANETGRQADLVIRLVRGSADDKFMSALLSSQRSDFANFILMTGELIKRIGDGSGNVLADTYILDGGIFSKQVEAKSNVAGDTEQSISIYNLKFANSPRTIG